MPRLCPGCLRPPHPQRRTVVRSEGVELKEQKAEEATLVFSAKQLRSRVKAEEKAINGEEKAIQRDLDKKRKAAEKVEKECEKKGLVPGEGALILEEATKEAQQRTAANEVTRCLIKTCLIRTHT